MGTNILSMRRIAIFLQLLFYSFIFIPDAHSIAPLSVVEVDNLFKMPSIYSLSYVIGLTGLFSVLVILDYNKAFIINTQIASLDIIRAQPCKTLHLFHNALSFHAS